MDHSSKIKILNQLSRTRGEITERALEKEADRIKFALVEEVRFDQIKELIETLDAIAFRVPSIAVTTIRDFLNRVEQIQLKHNVPDRADKLTITRYETKSGLIVQALRLLDNIRYHSITETVEIAVAYLEHDDSDVRARASENLRHAAEYNIDVYYSGEGRAGFGAAPQLAVVDWMEDLGQRDKADSLPALVELSRNLLSANMEGTSWDYRSVTWSTACIPADDEIIDVRRRALALLTTLYGDASSLTDKEAILSAMLTAAYTPHQCECSKAVIDTIANDAIEVLRFYKEIVPTAPLQIVQKIEHDTFWRHRHATRPDVKQTALEIRDAIAHHEEYTIYKNLIGFEGVFEDWESPSEGHRDVQRIDEQRSAMAQRYASEINSENWEEWHRRILEFSKTESNDLATFPKFYEFLAALAHSAPQLAFELLAECLDDIYPFVIPLMRGLWAGPMKTDLRALMLDWLEDGRQLVPMTKLFLSTDDLDLELLQGLMQKGMAEKNAGVLNQIIAVVAANHSKDWPSLVSEFFLPTIQALTTFEDASWVQEHWYRKELRHLLDELSQGDWEIVLNGMLAAEDIDYHAETLLLPLAKKEPERVLSFFMHRIEFEEAKKLASRYTAIPYKFHHLDEELANSCNLAVDLVRSRFHEDTMMFQYREARLLAIIFPEFGDQFETKLLELVRTSSRDNIHFVLSILRNYEGQTFLQGVCREIVAKLPKEDELLGYVSIALECTGVLVGEFGRAEALERLIEEVRPWLADENESVRAFAESFSEHWKSDAESERRRAEEQIELRKHTFGVRVEEEDQEGATEV